MDLSPRSMAAVWMVGLEEEPERSAEICIFEVFGDALGVGTAADRRGGHGRAPLPRPSDHRRVRDAARAALDVTDFHVYAADWRPGRVDFLIDGEHRKTVSQAPGYPMQMMVAVFDFPDKADSSPDPGHVPELVVDYVTRPLSEPDAAHALTCRA